MSYPCCTEYICEDLSNAQDIHNAMNAIRNVYLSMVFDKHIRHNLIQAKSGPLHSSLIFIEITTQGTANEIEASLHNTDPRPTNKSILQQQKVLLNN